MNAISQTAMQTPWWVYVLLVYLITMGTKASKTRVVSLVKLFIIPIIFIFMSIHTLISSFRMSVHTVSTWSIAIILGVVLGYLQMSRYTFEIDRVHRLIKIPGTWTTLVFILIIFVSKYYFSYQLSVDPAIVHETTFKYLMLGLSGVFTGLFIGRLICYLYQFMKNPSVNLIKQSD